MSNNRSDVEELVYDTCMLLDAKDFKGFLERCDERFEYKLSAYSPEIKREMTWLDHGRAEISELFNTLPRHNTDPSPLTRNAVVYKVKVDDDAKRASVVSALQVFRTAINGGVTELFAIGKYYDHRRPQWRYAASARPSRETGYARFGVGTPRSILSTAHACNRRKI